MKRLLMLSLVLAILMTTALALTLPAMASPDPQNYYYTPTAELNGNIYYLVKEGDSCIGIALLNNITEDQLRGLNNLNLDDCRFLLPGRKLLSAVITPTPPPSGPQPTATPLLPSPTPFSGFGQVCVWLFNDINGNARAETGETQIPGGAVSLADNVGKVNQTADTTAALDPVCFTELPEGTYTISAAPPQGYNPTTQMSLTIKLNAGDQSTLDFGAQVSSSINNPDDPTTGPSPLLGIIGGVVILAAIGLAIYARKSLR